MGHDDWLKLKFYTTGTFYCSLIISQCMYADKHTDTHPHTHIHTYILWKITHKYIHIQTHTCTTYTHTYMHINTYIYTHTNTRITTVKHASLIDNVVEFILLIF